MNFYCGISLSATLPYLRSPVQHAQGLRASQMKKDSNIFFPTLREAIVLRELIQIDGDPERKNVDNHVIRA